MNYLGYIAYKFEISDALKNGGDIQCLYNVCKIVKDGNVELFVYQLEKMNDIVKEMAELINGDFTEWEMGNTASDKRIANSYKHTQKEIKISQEYFDKCLGEYYVSCFYSDKDIEKFKARWRFHIRENC